MHPYRSPDFTAVLTVPSGRGRTFLGRVRSWWRKVLLWDGGRFLDRYPVRCPCGKPSWDPHKVRSGGVGATESCRSYHVRANQYRCGERHDLRGTVLLS